MNSTINLQPITADQTQVKRTPLESFIILAERTRYEQVQFFKGKNKGKDRTKAITAENQSDVARRKVTADPNNPKVGELITRYDNMRKFQKLYFTNRMTADLRQAESWEKAVDQSIKELRAANAPKAAEKSEARVYHQDALL